MKLRTTYEIQENKKDKWIVLSIFDQEEIAENDAVSLGKSKNNPIRIIRDTYNDQTLASEREVIFSSVIRKNIERQPNRKKNFKQSSLNWKGLTIDLEMLRYSAGSFLIVLILATAIFMI